MASKAVKKKLLRLALIASEHTLCEYSMFLEHLLVGLADESVPVVLVCPPGPVADSITSGTVEVIRHPAVELPLMQTANRKLLVDRLAKFNPGVLHCLCQTKAALTRRLARHLDLPYVLMVNSLLKRWDRLSVSPRRCAKIIVPARSIGANIAGLYPRFAERIEQINIGTFVAQDVVCFSRFSRLATMVMTHPMDNVDDFENLFTALRHMTIDGYEFMLVIAGGGRDQSQLRKLLSALGLLQIVTVVPMLKPFRSLLAAGDIFVQPQPRNVFDPFLFEAMSVGVAVAACKGGVDDLIMDDRTAVLFDPNYELGIMATLQRLLGRRELARKIARNAQQHLKENHSVSKMVSATLQAYDNAESWYKNPNL